MASGAPGGADGVKVIPDGVITPLETGRSIAVTGVMGLGPFGVGASAAGTVNVEATAGVGGWALGEPGIVNTGIDLLTTSFEIGAGVNTGLLPPAAGMVSVGKPGGGVLFPRLKAGAGPGGADGAPDGGADEGGSGAGTDDGGGEAGGAGNGVGVADSGAGINSVRRAGP
jgi:hypothetical protein